MNPNVVYDQRVAINIVGIGQQFGLSDRRRATVFNDGSQFDRSGRWCVVNWCDIKSRGPSDVIDAVGNRVVEAHASVVISRWSIAPSAVAVVD